LSKSFFDPDASQLWDMRHCKSGIQLAVRCYTHRLMLGTTHPH